MNCYAGCTPLQLLLFKLKKEYLLLVKTFGDLFVNINLIWHTRYFNALHALKILKHSPKASPYYFLEYYTGTNVSTWDIKNYFDISTFNTRTHTNKIDNQNKYHKTVSNV